MSKENLPRATHTGKIGDITVYVLDDGRCVLSKRQAAKQLIGDSQAGNFDRFCRSLSKKNKWLATDSQIEFLDLQGRPSLGTADEHFADVVDAAVEGMVMQTLEPRQYRIAQQAFIIQKSYSKIGLRAHILSVTGAASKTIGHRIACFADNLFRKEPRKWDKRFGEEFISAVCCVYGWEQDGNRIPQQMAAIFVKLYKLIVGEDGYAELKKLCPHPKFGNNQHQWMCDRIDQEMPLIVSGVTHMAKKNSFGSKKERISRFWVDVEEYLGLRPIQGGWGW